MRSVTVTIAGASTDRPTRATAATRRAAPPGSSTGPAPRSRCAARRRSRRRSPSTGATAAPRRCSTASDVVAEARPAALDVPAREPVGLDDAAAASAALRLAARPPVPDLLRLRARARPRRRALPVLRPRRRRPLRRAVDAAPVDRRRTCDPLFAWAALDCPSSAPVHGTIVNPVVLGRLTVALEGPIAVGAPHVIQSWLERDDGRKRHTAVALFTADGERRAAGRAVWVELARPLGA